MPGIIGTDTFRSESEVTVTVQPRPTAYRARGPTPHRRPQSSHYGDFFPSFGASYCDSYSNCPRVYSRGVDAGLYNREAYDEWRRAGATIAFDGYYEVPEFRIPLADDLHTRTGRQDRREAIERTEVNAVDIVLEGEEDSHIPVMV